MLIYLASPIDLGRPEIDKRRKEVCDMVVNHDQSALIFDPSRAWRLVWRPDTIIATRLRLINATVLSNADAMIAILDPDIQTIGTVAEIIACSEGPMTRPVCVFGSTEFRSSLYLKRENITLAANIGEVAQWYTHLISNNSNTQ